MSFTGSRKLSRSSIQPASKLGPSVCQKLRLLILPRWVPLQSFCKFCSFLQFVLGRPTLSCTMEPHSVMLALQFYKTLMIHPCPSQRSILSLSLGFTLSTHIKVGRLKDNPSLGDLLDVLYVHKRPWNTAVLLAIAKLTHVLLNTTHTALFLFITGNSGFAFGTDSFGTDARDVDYKDSGHNNAAIHTHSTTNAASVSISS